MKQQMQNPSPCLLPPNPAVTLRPRRKVSVRQSE